MKLKPGDPVAPTLSLAAGLAVIEAVDAAAPGKPLLLKWPNDLLLGGKKLAGVLLERSGDRLVAGFGVNLASAHNLDDREAAALGGLVTAQAFAPLLAASFSRLLAVWRLSQPGSLARAWLARAHAEGTELSVHVGTDEIVTGHFDGIETDGAMRLRRGDGSVELIRAGDVTL